MLSYCRYIGFFTSHGLYRSVIDLDTNDWVHITMVYDLDLDSSTAGQVLVDDTKYTLGKWDRSEPSYPAGTGNMLLGRLFFDRNQYSNGLIDDLAMWNRKLTKEEINEIKESEI